MLEPLERQYSHFCWFCCSKNNRNTWRRFKFYWLPNFKKKLTQAVSMKSKIGRLTDFSGVLVQISLDWIRPDIGRASHDGSEGGSRSRSIEIFWKKVSDLDRYLFFIWNHGSEILGSLIIFLRHCNQNYIILYCTYLLNHCTLWYIFDFFIHWGTNHFLYRLMEETFLYYTKILLDSILLSLQMCIPVLKNNNIYTYSLMKINQNSFG